MKCTYTKPNKKQCQANAMAGEKLCFSHNPKVRDKKKAGIEKVADDFWSDRLEQKSRSFWDNIKNLKNRLYSDE